MTLTERERFIQHFSTISTMRVMMEKMEMLRNPSPSFFEKELTEEERPSINKSDVMIIRKTRCRKLTSEEIHGLFEEMSEEALLGGNVINELIEDP